MARPGSGGRHFYVRRRSGSALFTFARYDRGMASLATCATSPLSAQDAAQYWREGYAVVRGLFSRDEVTRIAEAIDAIHAEGLAHGAPTRIGNLFYNVAPDDGGGAQVRLVQWPSYHNAVLNAVRLDRRMAALVRPLIGDSLKQIINQLHWKRPGGANTQFAWHQDCRFRRPPEAYRTLATSYVQTGLALDSHNSLSGGLRIVPRSHLRGDLDMAIEGTVMDTVMCDAALDAVGLDPAAAVQLDLAPGDVALWTPYSVHGSGPNRSDHFRRFYINGYIRAADCDRGEWAFRDGEPVPFGMMQAAL